MRKGLYIDDDEVKHVDQYQTLDPNRKKGKFQKGLDSLLFGAPPVTKKSTIQYTATELRNNEQLKSSSKTMVQPKVILPTGKPITPVKPIALTKTNTISIESSKERAENIYDSSITRLTLNANSIKPTKLYNKFQEEESMIVKNNHKPGESNLKSTEISKETQLGSTLEKTNNNAAFGQKSINHNQDMSLLDGIKPQQFNKQPPPAQPVRYEEPKVLDNIYPYPIKMAFNRPGYIRKLKKIAEDHNFAEENVNRHFAFDVVRFCETDRTRQKKLNQYNFSDFIFPPSSLSIGGKHKSVASVWKKPSQLSKTVVFGKYIDPNDLCLGMLSSTHFLSTLSSLCESQINIKRLIQDQKFNNNGFYLIRLFINSVWRYIPVDSLLPFMSSQNVGVLSHADAQFELSLALIEKAYAKSFGGYDTFSKVQPRQYYLRDLTGAPVTKYSVDNPQLSTLIKKEIAAGKVILAVPTQKISTLGINPNYSYNVINLTSKGNLQLRNSWGTLEEKSKVNFKNEGIFQLSPTQTKDFISHIIIAHLNPTYFTSTIQSCHKLSFYSSYNFKITKDTHGYLTVSQWDQRLFPSAGGYEYSPFHLIIHKVESEEQSTLVNASFSESSRNLDLQVILNPGNYVVFCAANWINKQQCYNLTFYGSEKIQFQRVYTDKIPNLINQSFKTISLKEGKRTQINKSIAHYFLYHYESNLIILTVENISDKDSTATVDLSKVQLNHLALLTSHNKEENYSNKIDIEIDEYKGTPLTDKKWSVRLEAHQTFTWILAVDAPYNPENINNWGFN